MKDSGIFKGDSANVSSVAREEFMKQKDFQAEATHGRLGYFWQASEGV